MANFSTKLASTVSAAAIVASAMGASLVSAASEFLPYAEALAAKKVINSQNAESGYRLNDQITRAELAKVAANLGGYTAVKCTGNVYTDVTASLGDLCDAIETLAAAKVISTASNTFRPTANVTRAEMTKMILGALAVAPVANGSHKFADVSSTLGDLEGFINAAAEKNIVNKATYFRPNATGSRGEVFKIAARAAGIEVVTDDKKPNAKAGTVSVSLVGSAAAQYVPMNASSVNVGKIKVSAIGGDVKLESIVIARSGLGNPGDIESSNGIRFAHNGKIVSASSNYYNQFEQQGNIMFSPAINLKNGESIELDTLVSLNGKSNSQHQFSVVKVNKDTLSSPVTLGLVNTTSYEATTVSTELKSVSGVRAGSKEQKLVDISLAPKDRGVKITGFNITRSNVANKKASDDKMNYDLSKLLTNVKVYEDGKVLEGAKVEVSSDKIFVSGLNLDIPHGRKTLQLRGDVLLDGTSNKVSFVVEDSSDVSGMEVSTNQVFRVSPTKDNIVDVRITGVKNTFENNTRSNQTVSASSNNYVNFVDAKITSEVPVKITSLNIKPHSDNTITADKFDGDLIVRVNGTRVADVKAVDALKKEGTTIDKLGYIVDVNYPLNIVVEGRLKGATNNQKVRFTLTLPKDTVTDISNRPATLTTMSVNGPITTVKTATIDLVSSTRNDIRVNPEESKTYEIPFTLRSKTDDSSSKVIELESTKNFEDLVDTTKLAENIKLKLDGTQQEIKSVTYDTSTKKLTITLENDLDFYKDEDKKFVLEITTKANIGAKADIYELKYNGNTIPTKITVGSDKLNVEASLVNSGNDIATIKLINNSDKEVTLNKIEIAAIAKDTSGRFELKSLNLLDSSNADLGTAALKDGKFTFDGLTVKIPANGDTTIKVSTPARFGDEKFALSIRAMNYGGADDTTIHDAK